MMAARDAAGAVAVFGEPMAPDPGSASERLLLGDEVVHIPDVVDTEAYRSGVPSRLKLVEMIGGRHGSELGFGIGIAQGYATQGPDRLFRSLRLHRDRHGVQYSRAFSIAMTAWSAKVVTSSIWLLVNGSTRERERVMAPISSPSRNNGTLRTLRWRSPSAVRTARLKA